MKELSVFIDESGGIDSDPDYYIVAPVFHDQSEPIAMLVDNFISEHLEFFQGFDLVKVYYDNGQKVVKTALHAALGETIAQHAIEYRDADPVTYRLFQLADYICGIELTELRYASSKTGVSEERFFGSRNLFRRNYLKKLRRKRL